MVDISIGLADVQEHNTATAIIITGAPRSGTSLLGKLISTLGNIEYHHEPPMLWLLTGLLSMKVLSQSVASCFLKAYLHEELLVESVHGRRANLRPSDESLVLKSIRWEELLSRWQNIKNRTDAVKYIAEKNMRLAVKMPSVSEWIPFFGTALPQSRFIIIVRDGRDVVRSILKKGWLTDEGLRDNYWPYKLVGGQKVPSLVEDSVAEKWTKMNAATRACYLWRVDVEAALQIKGKASLKERLHIIQYEELRKNPLHVMREAATFLSTEFTDLTESGIRSVRPLSAIPERHAEDDFSDAVEHDELRKFREINAVWGYG